MTRAFAMIGLLAALTILPAGGASAQGQMAEVAMRNLAFEPQMLTVPLGTTVVWTNLDPYPDQHTVTADDGAFASDLLDEGQTFAITFDRPGTYQYYCVPHGSPGVSGMAGVVIVE
jgi:plastocyanin